MDTLLPALVLIVVALVGARVSFSTKQSSLGPQLLFRTGAHFVLVGFVLGPSGLELLTQEATQQLSPLLALGLGWVGFHFGLQLDRRALRQFPLRHYALALGQAAVAFAIFAAAAFIVARAVGLDDQVMLLLVLSAACTASVTTPAGIAMVSATFRVKGDVRNLLLFIGSIDAIVGITALQITYALYRPDAVAGGLDPSQLVFVGLAVGVGLICGIVFLWLTRSRPAAEELVLFLLGACAFAAGVALQWSLSPLFVSAIMGALAANLSRSAERIQILLSRWEKPVYVTFLLIAGALIQIPTWLVFPMAVGYAALRFVAKTSAAGLLVGVVRFPFEVPRQLGLGLIPQGGISIAMAVSAALMYSDLRIRGVDAEAVLFAVIVMGVALAELTGPFLTMRLLERAGETPAGETPAGEIPEETPSGLDVGT
jgi:hypothetical protein